MSRFPNIAFHHFIKPMGLSLIVGIISFSEKHLLIVG
jgi:hypothetical protein